MKSRATIVVAFALLVLWIVPFHDAHAAQHSVSVDVRQAVNGLFGVEYEVARTRDVSLTVRGLYATASDTSTSVSGLSTGIGMRKYIDGSVHHGPYVGGNLTGAMLTVKEGSERGSLLSLGAQATLGYKVVLDGGMSVDLGASVGMPVYTRIKWEDESESTTGGNLGMDWGLFVGYAW